MTYHPLTEDSGGSDKSRAEEAVKICRILEEHVDEMSEIEKKFIEQMTDCDYCSTKQLFWLRDIKAKYAD